MDTYLHIIAAVDALSDTTFVKTLIAIVFWIGGFAAAPMLFMATMGIFRNLAGMSSGFTKGMRGKMTAKGQAAKERGYKAWKADKEATRELTAQRRGSVIGAGSMFTRKGRAARRGTRQQIAQQQANAAAEDSSYTWREDGELNRLYLENHSDLDGLVGTTRSNGSLITTDDVARMRAMESKYGKQAFREVAHAQALAGKGYKAGEEEEVWRMAAEIAGDDDHALASIVGRSRGAAMKAGLGSIGGGSFSGTMSFARGKDKKGAYTTDRHMDDVIDSTGADSLFHPGMTKESVEKVSARLAERVVAARRTVDTAATPAARAAAEIEYKRRLADVAGAYDIMSRLPAAKGDEAATALMGVGLLDASGNKLGTIRDEVEAHRTDRDFLDRRREYGSERARSLGEGETPPIAPGGSAGGPSFT